MASKDINPFICQGYKTPEYFCDRVEETKRITNTLYNGRNITLTSPRRLGKTGLIWNTFHHIRHENKDAICIYLDIFPTKNQTDFIKALGSAVVEEAINRNKSFGKKALELLASLQPTIGLDPLSGMPSVSLNINPSQPEISIRTIFNYLKNIPKEIFIALDEFQQITTYPETGTEALLRSFIQFSHNTHFIFSGSKQHLMTKMFASAQRPFYQSTELMTLTQLDEENYYQFANNFFAKRNGHFDREVFRLLYKTFDGYTWYIQSILNRLYEQYNRVDSEEQLNKTILSVVENNAPQYESLLQFLTDNQFAVLSAIAKNGKVEQPTNKDFIREHHLPSASSIKTVIDTLTGKELIYRQKDGYIIYDRFLDIWLRRL